MRVTLFTIAFVACFALQAIGQDGPGGRAGAPFRVGFDARSMGSGNAVSAHAAGDHSSAYNPALLPFVTSQSIYMGAGLLSLDRSLFHLSYATPLPPSAGLGISITGARVGDLQGRDINGQQTEIYSTNEYAVALSFGLQPARDFSIGVSAKLLHARLMPELSSTTVGLDFGASYLVLSWLRMGVALRDVNSRYRWDTTPVYGRNGNNTVDQFPRRFVIAAAGDIPDSRLRILTEMESVAGITFFRAGIEYMIHPHVILRTGADGLDMKQRVGTRITFGGSIENTGFLWNPSIDYAFMAEPFAPIGSHILTLRFHPGE